MRLHLVPNSHIDPVWLWDKYEGIDEVINTFRSACDKLEEFPALTFTASSLQFYAWVLHHEPALFKRIQKHVEAGRWEVAGGWWIEADSNLPTEVSLHQQARVAQAFARQHFGKSIVVSFLPDSFGHPASLPKVLADTGFKYFIFCRPQTYEKPDLPANLFQWEFAGHRILSYRLKQHYMGRTRGEKPSDTGPLHDPEYGANPVNCYFFGIGDHGGGPTLREIHYYNQYIEMLGKDQADYSSCQRFFDEAARLPNVPVYSGDLHMHAVGCYSVVRDLKHAVRSNEHLLQFAQRALALTKSECDKKGATGSSPASAWDVSAAEGRLGIGTSPALADKLPVPPPSHTPSNKSEPPETPAALEPLWLKVLFNEFHDILPGSCSPDAADQARAEMGGVSDAARDLSYRALKRVAQSRPVQCKEGEFRIFNTLPYPITRPLHVESFTYYRDGAAFRDQDGREIAIQEVQPSVRCYSDRRWTFVDTLPARGFKSYWFDNETTAARPAQNAIQFVPGTTASTITSDLADVHANGHIRVGPEGQRRPLFKRPPRFIVLDDTSDTWSHGVRAFDDVAGTFQLDSTATMEGPVAASLYQRWSWGRSWIETVHTIYRGQWEIYLDITVHWAESRKILKYELLPPQFAPVFFTMEGPGGLIRRDANGIELPMHHVVSFVENILDLAIVQDGAFACDCESGRLRLTLVRSSYYGYDDNTPLNPANPERLTDQGEHRFRLALLTEPGLNQEKISRFKAGFLEPCWVVREGHAGAGR